MARFSDLPPEIAEEIVQWVECITSHQANEDQEALLDMIADNQPLPPPPHAADLAPGPLPRFPPNSAQRPTGAPQNPPNPNNPASATANNPFDAFMNLFGGANARPNDNPGEDPAPRPNVNGNQNQNMPPQQDQVNPTAPSPSPPVVTSNQADPLASRGMFMTQNEATPAPLPSTPSTSYATVPRDNASTSASSPSGANGNIANTPGLPYLFGTAGSTWPWIQPSSSQSRLESQSTSPSNASQSTTASSLSADIKGKGKEPQFSTAPSTSGTLDAGSSTPAPSATPVASTSASSAPSANSTVPKKRASDNGGFLANFQKQLKKSSNPFGGSSKIPDPKKTAADAPVPAASSATPKSTPIPDSAKKTSNSPQASNSALKQTAMSDDDMPEPVPLSPPHSPQHDREESKKESEAPRLSTSKAPNQSQAGPIASTSTNSNNNLDSIHLGTNSPAETTHAQEQQRLSPKAIKPLPSRSQDIGSSSSNNNNNNYNSREVDMDQPTPKPKWSDLSRQDQTTRLCQKISSKISPTLSYPNEQVVSYEGEPALDWVTEHDHSRVEAMFMSWRSRPDFLDKVFNFFAFRDGFPNSDSESDGSDNESYPDADEDAMNPYLPWPLVYAPMDYTRAALPEGYIYEDDEEDEDEDEDDDDEEGQTDWETTDDDDSDNDYDSSSDSTSETGPKPWIPTEADWRVDPDTWSYPDGLPTDPILPLMLVSRPFLHAARKVLYAKGVNIHGPWPLHLFVRTLTSPQVSAFVQDNSVASKSTINTIVRVLNLHVACTGGSASLGRGAIGLVANAIENCPKVETLSLRSDPLKSAWPVLEKALRSAECLQDISIRSGSDELYPMVLSTDRLMHLAQAWPSLRSIDVLGLSSAPPLSEGSMSRALTSLSLSSPDITGEELGQLLEQSGDTLKTFKLVDPTNRLTRGQLAQILVKQAPNLIELALTINRDWQPRSSSSPASASPELSQFFLHTIISKFKKLEVLHFFGPLANSQIFALLPPSLKKLSFGECLAIEPRKMAYFLAVPNRNGQKRLPKLTCVTVIDDDLKWEDADFRSVQTQLQLRGACFHNSGMLGGVDLAGGLLNFGLGPMF